MSKLYVGNLSYDVNEDQLSQLFSAKGEVVSVKIINDQFSGRSKGFGFVEMSNTDEAQAVISEFNGYEFEGRSLKVNEAIDKPRGGGGNRRGGGGGGNRRY